MTSLPDYHLPAVYLLGAIVAVFVLYFIYRHRVIAITFALEGLTVWAWMAGKLPGQYVIYSILLTLAFGTAKAMIGGRNVDMRRTYPVRFWVWRYFTGYPLDGKRRTNRTFWARGTRPAATYVTSTWWGYQPGWVVLAFRLGVPVLLVLIGLLYSSYPGPTKGGGWLIGDLFITYYVVRLFTYFQGRSHARKWVAPLHAAISSHLGYSPTFPVKDYLTFPRSFRDDPSSVIRIDVPDDYHAGLQGQATLHNIIASKLGMREIRVEQHLEGHDAHLLVRHAPLPPRSVSFAMVRDAVLKLAENTVFMGCGASSRNFTVNLDTESPHIGVSVSTGGGKSILLQWLGAQFLFKGARLIILDIKQVSQRWAGPLSGVVYMRTAEEIHNYLVELQQEMMRRYEILRNHPYDEPLETADIGERLVIFIEELNVLFPMLRMYWNDVRTSSDPKESPAIMAFRYLLFMGRGSKMHLVVVAQHLNAQITGGPAARECLGLRVLGRFSAKVWRMLCDDISPMPPTTTRPGDVYCVFGGEASRVQIPLITDAEAREMSRLGAEKRAPKPVLTLVKTDPDEPTEEIDMERKELRLPLRQAVEFWLPWVTYETARKARTRARKGLEPHFPVGEHELGQHQRYTREEIENWAKLSGRWRDDWFTEEGNGESIQRS